MGLLFLVFQDQVSSKRQHGAEDSRSQVASGNSNGAESLVAGGENKAGGNIQHGHSEFEAGEHGDGAAGGESETGKHGDGEAGEHAYGD